MSSKQKMNRKNKEAFNVTKIYEHVKSRKFLEQLCLECIQDVKQKPAYQSLKGMVDRLLDNSMESIGSPSNDADRITNMRMQVAECGMLAYTIDCVVAEVVCNKLEKEYFSIVKGMVTELAEKHNVEVTDNMPNNALENHINGTQEEQKEESVSNQASAEGSGRHNGTTSTKSQSKKAAEKSSPKSILKNRNSNINGNLSSESPSKGQSSYIVKKNEHPNTRNYNADNKVDKEIKTERPIPRAHNQVVDIVISKDMCHNAAGREMRMNQVEVRANNATNRPQSVLEIVSSPVQSNNSSNSTCKVVVVSPHGAIIKHVISHDNANANIPPKTNSNSSAPVPSSPVVESVKPNVSAAEEVRKSPRKGASPKKCSNYAPTPSDDESDVDKAFSVGSVSPVHTSDLSSFDDLISLSEDDEQGKSKKKIRLKDANTIFLDGKLPELYRKKKRGKPKSSPKTKSSIGKVIQPEHDSSSSEEESADWTPRKSLPQRKRKPNSKYDSEIYKCNLKQFINSEDPDPDPEYKEGKRPPHNRTEPRPAKKLSLDPVSEDILSITNHLPLSKQSEEVIIGNQSTRNDDNELSKDLNSSPAADSIMRKRGRPRRQETNQDANSSSFCEKDNSNLSARKRGRPRKVSEMTPSFTPPTSGKRMSNSKLFVSRDETPKRLRNDSEDSSQMRMAEISPSKEKNSKRYASSELYKPRSNISSFGSRNHRIITLCSSSP